jgi:hypothetical protein
MKQPTKTKIWIVLSVLIVLIALLVTPVMAAGSGEVNRYVIGSGVGTATDGNYTLNGTIGQPLTGLCNNADVDLCAGFWCQVFAYYKIFLPLVLKD